MLKLLPIKDANIPHPFGLLYSSDKIQHLSLSKFYLFSFGFVCRAKVIYKWQILIKLRHASRFFCIVQVALT